MLEIKNLCKRYPSFFLDNVSFNIPSGYIMGFIGNNGAGKSTTLKCILNLTHKDSGKVLLFGKDMDTNELQLKQDIGYMYGGANYYMQSKVKKILTVYSRFYDNWDKENCAKYLKKFKIDENKRITELSEGMKVKLALTLALSHNAKLLILDEPTSGLDPSSRDELMDIFQEFVINGDKSILFSTHITSDLDRCADFITFIKDGKIIFTEAKDDLTQKYALIAGKDSALTQDLKNKMIGYKENQFGFTGLIVKNEFVSTDLVEKQIPNIQDIMVYYNLANNKGDR